MRFYNLNEVSRLTGYRVRTLRDKCQRGLIRATQPDNWRHWLVPEDEIERLRKEKEDWVKYHGKKNRK